MKSIIISLLICIGLFCLSINCETKEVDLRMPNVSPHLKDSYLCYQKEIDGEDPFYIRKFVPQASKNVAHHILIYACENPGSKEEVWSCGEMNVRGGPKSQWNHGPLCKGEQKIIYAWAKDAPQLELPEGSDLLFFYSMKHVL